MNMLPNMPLIFTISRDSVFQVQPEQISTLTPIPSISNTSAVNSLNNVNFVCNSAQNNVLNACVPNQLPAVVVDNDPAYDKACDELVLLAENSPFCERRRQIAKASAARKKRKLETTKPVKPVEVKSKVHETKAPKSESLTNQFATAYFMKLKNKLDTKTFQKFISLLSEIKGEKADVVTLYRNVCALLAGHSELINEFLGFLNPIQAQEVGKLYEYLAFKHTWNFFNKLDAFHFNKLMHLLEQHSKNTKITSEMLRSSLQAAFKGHPNITETILTMLPGGKPPVSKKEDFEDISHLTSPENPCETLSIEESTSKGCSPEHCKCICHSCAPKKFCTFCNIKFSKGQIYVQTSKGLRFAKVEFRDCQQEDVLQQLNPTYYSKPTTSKRTKSTSHFSKGNNNNEVEPKRKCDLPIQETVMDPLKPSVELKKETKESVILLADEQDNEILYLEQLSGYDNLDLDSQVTVFEDFVLDCTNSEAVDNPAEESQSVNEIVKLSGASIKFEESVHSSEQDFEEIFIEESELSNSGSNATTFTFEAPFTTESSSSSKFNDNTVNSTITVSTTEEVAIDEENNIRPPQNESTEQFMITPNSNSEKLEESTTKVWTREEDRLILQAFQRQIGTDQTFSEICETIPSRTVDDIQGRFKVLLNLLEKMTSGCFEGYP